MVSAKMDSVGVRMTLLTRKSVSGKPIRSFFVSFRDRNGVIILFFVFFL
ncbi:MAG: hypothetical protein BWX48_03310 [Verrucomicrobia bacterium ADurb.Bin006]|jgi:hypothetical protein|nr:MAG: hypothetical protein BWX48_03310 [Verrucomicrobia bacterium ADurb.Bin006]